MQAAFQDAQKRLREAEGAQAQRQPQEQTAGILEVREGCIFGSSPLPGGPCCCSMALPEVD